MRYSTLLQELINKILNSSRTNFITTNYSSEYNIKKIILNKFPEFGKLADQEMELDTNALLSIDTRYDIILNYKIHDADIIEKIINHCISKQYDFNIFVMSIALLEDIMINGTREMFGHHILTLEYVIKTYVDDFVEDCTEHIRLSSDKDENDIIKFNCIIEILSDNELYNLLVSQASGNILVNWLSDFNDLLLFHYRDEPLEKIKEDTLGLVSYVSAELKVFSVTT